MREEYKANEWRDFKQRYEGTYGWYETDSGKKVLVLLTEVTDKELRFIDKSENSYTAIPDKGNTFQFLPIERGVHNITGDIIYCERIPARQWRRGLHISNTRMTSLLSNKHRAPDFGILEQIFEQKDDSLLRAFQKNGTGSAALNSTFSIVGKAVKCYSINIGTFLKGKITLDNPLFHQEICDVVRDLQLPITVEVAA